MEEYTHGGDVWRYDNSILDFSASLNPLGMPPEVVEAAVRGIADSLHYPDPACRALCQSIAQAIGVSPKQIVCGNGAAELLDRLIMAVRPKKALILAPSFGEYKHFLVNYECKVYYHYLKKERSFELTHALLRVLRPELDLLILCNPNNPTGRTIPGVLMFRILECCRELDITLLMDESFLDLTDRERRVDLLPFLEKYPNLVLLRSMTKSYSMPGLRLGYLLTSNHALPERLALCGQPWGVSVPAQYAGIAAMQRPDWPERGCEVIRPQRERLQRELQLLGAGVWESHTNYLLFQVPGVGDLREQLLNRGILIRSCASFRGLGEDFYRIAVRTGEENTALLTALRECLGKGRD